MRHVLQLIGLTWGRLSCLALATLQRFPIWWAKRPCQKGNSAYRSLETLLERELSMCQIGVCGTYVHKRNLWG
jgi:hypothetical protein